MTLTAMVREFHERFGYALDRPLKGPHSNPGVTEALKSITKQLLQLSEDIATQAVHYQEAGDMRLYRAHLMIEELGEGTGALADEDEVALADALGDLDYVSRGTAENYGLPMEFVHDEIHRSNMSKQRAADDPRMRVKGVGYFPPDILGAINHGRWRKQQGY